VEIKVEEHSDQQTGTMDVTKEATTYKLWRSQMQNSDQQTGTMDVTEEAATYML
jgi:hypothetical protein